MPPNRIKQHEGLRNSIAEAARGYFASSSRPRRRPVRRNSAELTDLDWTGIESCDFTGGEPFLEEECVARAQEAIPSGKGVFILTNGTKMPAKTILHDRRVMNCVPLYSAGSSIHDATVGRHNCLYGSQQNFGVSG